MELSSAPHRPRFALSASDVTKLFGDTVALWDITADSRSGELLAIHGANGSGKSTLLRIIAGLITPTRGRVAWTADAAPAAPRIAFQGHLSHLFDDLTAAENVGLAARLAGRDEVGALGLLARLGVECFAARPVRSLSAGTRRRVGLARAIATDPDVLLVDEPFAGLDEQAAVLVRAVLADVRDHGRLVAIATHDASQSARMSTTSLELEAGRIRRPDAALAYAT